jgi:hypothetical protein
MIGEFDVLLADHFCVQPEYHCATCLEHLSEYSIVDGDVYHSVLSLSTSDHSRGGRDRVSIRELPGTRTTRARSDFEFGAEGIVITAV